MKVDEIVFFIHCYVLRMNYDRNIRDIVNDPADKIVEIYMNALQKILGVPETFIDRDNESKTTNGDRLRKMSNEELAKFIYRCDPVCDNGKCTGSGDEPCIRCAIDYLNKESEE